MSVKQIGRLGTCIRAGLRIGNNVMLCKDMDYIRSEYALEQRKQQDNRGSSCYDNPLGWIFIMSPMYSNWGQVPSDVSSGMKCSRAMARQRRCWVHSRTTKSADKHASGRMTKRTSKIKNSLDRIHSFNNGIDAVVLTEGTERRSCGITTGPNSLSFRVYGTHPRMKHW